MMKKLNFIVLYTAKRMGVHKRCHKRPKFIILFTLCLFLSGCGTSSSVPPSTEERTPSVIDTSKSESKADLDMSGDLQEIQGYALESIGYRIDAPEEIGEDVNTADRQYHPHYRIYIGNENYSFTPDCAKMQGEFTLVSVQVPGVMSINDIAAMYLQAFYNEDLLQKAASIKIDGKRYPVKELTAYKIWEDDQISVYNFYDLICDKTFSEQLSAYVEQVQNEPSIKDITFSWLEEVNMYFQENITGMIKKGEASYITQDMGGI